MEAESKMMELISLIRERNAFQWKALDGLMERLNPEEKAGFAALLEFYLRQGDTIEHLADCYLKFLSDISEEQIYFVENRRYRYSSIREVNAFFYQNPEYMEYYMKGLAVSTYLLESHRRCRAWYESKIENLPGGGRHLAGCGRGAWRILHHGDTAHAL